MKNPYKIGDRVTYRKCFFELEVTEITKFGTLIVSGPTDEPLEDREIYELEWHELKRSKPLNGLQKMKRRLKKWK